jgi:hypothetical protein
MRPAASMGSSTLGDDADRAAAVRDPGAGALETAHLKLQPGLAASSASGLPTGST